MLILILDCSQLSESKLKFNFPKSVSVLGVKLSCLILTSGEKKFRQIIDSIYKETMSPVAHREHTHRGKNSGWKRERDAECEKEGG